MGIQVCFSCDKKFKSYLVLIPSYREEALKLFQRHPLLSAWDPETLKLYVECGLQEDADGSVRLKMSRILVGDLICSHHYVYSNQFKGGIRLR